MPVPRGERDGVEFRVLGPVEVTASGQPLPVGGARARAVLAMLLAHANEAVSSDRLTEELWPGQRTAKAAASLQVRLSELRRAFRGAGEADRLATRPPGYLLTVDPAELDSLRFARLAGVGAAALAAGDAAMAVQRLDEALSLWHGTAFAGMEAPSVRAEAGRLEEIRLGTLESRAEALLECGRHAELIAELTALTAAHPWRERLWYARILALYRAGRQADSLRAYGDLRAMLGDELGIEPEPRLRDLHACILRQDPALGSPVNLRRMAGSADTVPQTRYVRAADGVHIAYQMLGHGERDIVFVPGLMSHLELLWEDPKTAGFFRRLATIGRLILFDKRDTGLSDRAAGDSTLEERMGDVRAVMGAAGSARAVLFGYSEGAPMSILFAATYPERVTSLVLGSAAARWFPAHDYPCGQGSEEVFKALYEIAEHRWGQGDTIEWYLPSRAGSPHARQLFARFERLAVSPSAFLRMLTMIREIDVRYVLPAISVPALVIQRLDDRINPPCHGRYLASHIPGARYFEQPWRPFAAVRRRRRQRRTFRRDHGLPQRRSVSPRTRARAGHHPAGQAGGKRRGAGPPADGGSSGGRAAGHGVATARAVSRPRLPPAILSSRTSSVPTAAGRSTAPARPASSPRSMHPARQSAARPRSVTRPRPAESSWPSGSTPARWRSPDTASAAPPCASRPASRRSRSPPRFSSTAPSRISSPGRGCPSAPAAVKSSPKPGRSGRCSPWPCRKVKAAGVTKTCAGPPLCGASW